MGIKSKVKKAILSGLSNKQVAKKLGVAQGQVNMIAIGVRIDSVNMLESIYKENGVIIQKLKPGYASGAEPKYNKRY